MTPTTTSIMSTITERWTAPSTGAPGRNSQNWDSAGRRTYLGTGIGMNFGYRADGLMTQAGNSTFTYANNGLLVSRTTGAKTSGHR